jgi:hypothetical protein
LFDNKICQQKMFVFLIKRKVNIISVVIGQNNLIFSKISLHFCSIQRQKKRVNKIFSAREIPYMKLQ